ncbi:LytTR family DNA-binding domain-containing protein [Telluribacter sp. SYSU D00476]|uniref:LytR/AlgR family response regulator transcription factor n=1 Tax=Telluribacter sp. SYSU D00476 TaxID=2811430 RepID=UPI001FF12314|nr:LytTR family DNA-binding domain-containing protein [Telluribacter sp. SYSU D00476]
MNTYTHTISNYPGKHHRLPFLFEDIVRLEGEGNYTAFTLIGGKQYITSRTLRFYEEMLPSSFVRIHKGCIINIAYLEKLCITERLAQLADGSAMSIARRRWPQFRDLVEKQYRNSIP